MPVRVAVRPNAGRNAPRYSGMPSAAGIINTPPDSLTGYAKIEREREKMSGGDIVSAKSTNHKRAPA